jgi:hypothetical protein
VLAAATGMLLALLVLEDAFQTMVLSRGDATVPADARVCPWRAARRPEKSDANLARPG